MKDSNPYVKSQLSSSYSLNNSEFIRCTLKNKLQALGRHNFWELLTLKIVGLFPILQAGSKIAQIHFIR